MKKLNKLKINSEKLMKSDELVTLRGGYAGHCCWCLDQNLTPWAMAAANSQDCATNCTAIPMIPWWDPICN
jgi:hypothetical protein